LFRREWPWFYAFDLLAVDGYDLRQLPLLDRKRRLKAIMPTPDSRVRYVQHVEGRGTDLFGAVCDRDLEGIVGKWRRGMYGSDPSRTSWVKIKNPTYTHAENRHEVFEKRRQQGPRSGRRKRPELLMA
jgi:bifunctional non-homologous end joining protein LigD